MKLSLKIIQVMLFGIFVAASMQAMDTVGVPAQNFGLNSIRKEQAVVFDPEQEALLKEVAASLENTKYCLTFNENDMYEKVLFMRVQKAAQDLGMKRKLLILFYDFKNESARALYRDGLSKELSEKNTAVIYVPKPTTYSSHEQIGFNESLFTAFHELGHQYLEPKKREITFKSHGVPALSLMALLMGSYYTYGLLRPYCPSFLGGWSRVATGIASLLVFRLPWLGCMWLGNKLAPNYFEAPRAFDINKYASEKQKKEIAFYVSYGREQMPWQWCWQREREVNADLFAVEQLVEQKDYDAIAAGFILEFIGVQGGDGLASELNHPAPSIRIGLKFKKLKELGISSVDDLLSRVTFNALKQRFLKYFEPVKKINPELFT